MCEGRGVRVPFRGLVAPFLALALTGCAALVERPAHPTRQQEKAYQQQLAGTVLFWTGAAASFGGAMLTLGNANERSVALGTYHAAVLAEIPGTGGPCDPKTHPEQVDVCSAHRDAAHQAWQDAGSRAFVGPVVLGTGLAAGIGGAALVLSADAPPRSPAAGPAVMRSLVPSACIHPHGGCAAIRGAF